MSDERELDRFVENLQRKIYREEEKIFSRPVIQEYRRPENVGRMSDADASFVKTGSCGDTMEFYLKVDEGVISDIRFMTDGCGPSIACGSRVTKMVMGDSIDGVKEIRDDDLLEELGGLPDDHVHCAKLAVDTLKGAVEKL